MTPGHLWYSGDSDSTALHQIHPVLYLWVESLNKIIPVHKTHVFFVKLHPDWFPDFYFIILVVKQVTSTTLNLKDQLQYMWSDVL